MLTAPAGTPQPAEDFSLYPPEVFLALSDYFDLLRDREWLGEHRGWHRGYNAGYRTGYHRGATEAMTSIKRINGALVEELQVEAARWGPRGRAGFAEPRPGDFKGRG